MAMIKQMKAPVLAIIVAVTFVNTAVSQIQGSGSSVGQPSTWTYSYNPGAIVVGPYWTTIKGTVNSSWVSGTTYYASVTWTTNGAGKVSFYEQ
jgi:hypothetical protein